MYENQQHLQTGILTPKYISLYYISIICMKFKRRPLDLVIYFFTYCSTLKRDVYFATLIQNISMGNCT